MHEVAGGECDKRLGKSRVQINILGCPGWIDILEQPGFEMLHQGVPAQMLEVQIVDILDDSQETITPLYEHFITEGPIIHTVNLLDTETEETVVGDEQQERKDKEGSPGIAKTDDFDTASDNQIGDTQKLKESVRFQYDGRMIMKVTLSKPKPPKIVELLDCKNYAQTEDTDVTQSFHVLNYMTTFGVDVQLRYELIVPVNDSPGVYCDQVDEEKVKIQIESNIGMDDAAGFGVFWDQLSVTDQGTLSACSTHPPPIPEDAKAAGPCLITPENKIGNFAGRKNIGFVTGRPYPVGRGTRFMLFKVLGVDEDVRHTAEFFIQGLFTKGPGSSFALPTHEPIMVLRDPPGKFWSLIKVNFHFMFFQ